MSKLTLSAQPRTGIQSQSPLLHPGPGVASRVPLGWGPARQPVLHGSAPTAQGYRWLSASSESSRSCVVQTWIRWSSCRSLSWSCWRSWVSPSSRPPIPTAAWLPLQDAKGGSAAPSPGALTLSPQSAAARSARPSKPLSLSGSPAGQQQRAEAGLQVRLAGV